jgi:serine kinase of HPr protein (carbohydrate metabolism regulator)
MTLEQVVKALALKVLCGETALDRPIKGGHVGDLLSFVMAHAQEGELWITIQGHLNSVAVASLLGLSGIILSEDMSADPEMLTKAEEEGIPILSSPLSSFELCYQLGKLLE